MPEQFGQRVSRLRNQQGWTQQQLADYLAMSRVAVSHMEAGLSIPSERTVGMLAGLFKLEPFELVEDSSYPEAKAERLPPTVCRYSEVELQLALLQRDLEWVERFRNTTLFDSTLVALRSEWKQKLAVLQESYFDERSAMLFAQAYDYLKSKS